MRILIYTNTTKNLDKEINFIQDNLYAKVDLFNDIEDTEYCLDIRHYDIVYLEYEKEHHKKYFNLFKSIEDKDAKPKVFLLTEDSLKDFDRYSFVKKESSQFDLKKHILKIMPDNEVKIIKRDNLTINIKNKNVFYEKDGEIVEIVFEKKFDFLVFLYFVRNYGDVINVSNLLDATCEEPEHAKDSLIESSISSIRKNFRELLQINPIKAFKKVGYQFSLGQSI